MINKTIFVFVILCLMANIFAGELNNTKRETRAVWLTTNFQLDWPPKVYDADEQKEALIRIFDKIKTLKLNTIYFQVRSNGTVLFKSAYEDYPFYLTGSFDEDPSYDPLEFAIQEAHKRGLQLHAWVNVMRCFANDASIDLENPKHLFQKKNEWINKRNVGDKIQGWLNPGLFNARAYLIDLFAEIVENYNVDGLHLDFMRYPGKDFSDEEIFKQEETELSIDDWRRENINKFLKVLYIRSKLIREDIKIGVTPIGIYKNQTDASGMQGFYDVYQESEKWLNEKYVDYVVPQIYWDLETNPKFDVLATDWKARTSGRRVILGIAAYKPEVKNQIKELIKVSREKKSDGVAFFRYQNIADIEEPIFDHFALPASMDWMKGEMPSLDINLSYSYLDKESNLVKFIWDKNTTNDNGYYLLVKSLPGEFSMDDVILTIPADKTSVILNLKNPRQLIYKFALKAMDRIYNLADGQSNDVAVYPGKLTSLYKLNNDFVKPRLLKEADGNLKLLMNIKKSELVEVYQVSNDKLKLIFSEFVNCGKNIFQMPDNNYQKIVIKFISSNKEVSLNL